MAVDKNTVDRWATYDAEQAPTAYDADTIQRENARNQRLSDIDAPEKAGTFTGFVEDMPGADAARAAMQRSLDTGARVEGTGEFGRKGRELVDVVDFQGNVGQDLVARGLAVPTGDNLDAIHFGLLDEVTGNRRRPEWDQFVDQAQKEEMDFLRNRFDAMLGEASRTYVRGVDNRPGAGAAARAALSRGTDQFQGSLYAFSNALGEVAGIDALAEWGEDGMLANMTQAALRPARIENYEMAMAGGFEGVGLYVLETLLENTPALAADISAALLTGGGSMLAAGVGKAALRKMGGASAVGRAGEVAGRAFGGKGMLTARPGTIGMGLSMEAQMVGETRQGQFQEGLEDEEGALVTAFGVGTAKAALEYAGLQTILRGVMRGRSPEAVREFADTLREAGDLVRLRDVAARALRSGGTGFLAEGTTEMLQQLLDEVGTAALDPDREVSLDEINLTQLLDAGIRGGIFGGTLGTAGATVSGVAGLRENLRQETLARQQPSPEATAAEPVTDLTAQAEARGAVWMSPEQTDAEREAVRSELAKQGEVFERTNDEGSTYLTTNPDDPLLDPEVHLTGDNLTRAKGLTPKSELDPSQEQSVVVARDAKGRQLEAAVTDQTNLQQTQEQVARLHPGAQIEVRTPEQVLAERQSEREAGAAAELPTEKKAPPPKRTREVKGARVLGDAGPSPARMKQAEKSKPAPKDEKKTPVFSDGKLRKPGELIADFKAGRLDRKELSRTLKIAGIDVNRFKKGKEVLDRARTREAMRQALASNRKLATKFARTPHGTTHELADLALKHMDEAPDSMWREAARELGVSLKTEEQLKPDARKVLLPRVRSRLKSAKLPIPVSRRIAERFIGTGASADTLLRGLDKMSDNDLIGVAEALGAPTKGLTEPAPRAADDVVGLFRELEERVGARAKPVTPKAPDPKKADAPLPKVQKLFSWAYDDQQRARTVAEVIEAAGSAEKAEAQLRSSMVESQKVFPELGQEVAKKVDRKALDNPDPTKQLEAWVKAWQSVLNESFEDKDFHAIPPEERVFIAEAARDLGVIERLAELADQRLDKDRLRQTYWAWRWSKEEGVSAAQFMKKNADAIAEAEKAVDKESVAQRLRNLIRFAASQEVIDPLTTDKRAEQQIADALRLAVADSPSAPEVAVIEAMDNANLLGGTASAFEAASIMKTGEDAPKLEGEQSEAQMQSDLVFYRAVNLSTLRFPQFLDPRSADIDPRQWSESEKDYQQVRGQFIADPMAFDREHRDTLLPQLVQTGGGRFTDVLTAFNAGEEARAMAHTKKADGRNLMLVEYETEGQNLPESFVFKLVDAVTLANYAKQRHPVNAAEAIANLESNLARLAQGPESSQITRRKTRKLVRVKDDVVIWFDPDGNPVTAGQARSMRKQVKAESSRTVEAARVRDEVAVELEELDSLIDTTLEQMIDLAESEGDGRTVKALQEIQATYTEVPKTREAREAARHAGQLAKLVEFDFGDGVVGSLKEALDRRLNLLGSLKRLGQEVQAGADMVGTSLRGEQADAAAIAKESEPETIGEGFEADWAAGRLDLDEEPGEFVPDPVDQAVFRSEADSVLPPVEQEVELLAASESRFAAVGIGARGLQMPLDGGDPFGVVAKKPSIKPGTGGTRKFKGTQVQGQAAKRQSFQALASFTRRMMVMTAKGMPPDQRAAFLKTPVTIVQTGDRAALDQIWKDAGRASMPRELARLQGRPGYLNLGSTVVISMDPLTPNGNPAEWALVYGHELGHMVYDQSWHNLSREDRKGLRDAYWAATGGNYNGLTGFAGFKEWFADQMSAAIAEDVTGAKRGQYAETKGVLGKVLRFMMDRLKRLWDAIQKDQTVRRLKRFKLNEDFAEFGRRVLKGQVPLTHRYAVGQLETMHFTPDEKPISRAGIKARWRQVLDGRVKLKAVAHSVKSRIRSFDPELAGKLFQGANEQRVAGGSYEQRRYALASRWQAALQRAFDDIAPGKKQQEAVNRAYTELRDGKDTAGAQRLGEVVDTLVADARKEGWVTGDQFIQNVPRAFDHAAIEARRGEFMELARKGMPHATDEELSGRIDRIIGGFGFEHLDHDPMGPGRPLGTTVAADELVTAIGVKTLVEKGFLQDKGFGILHHFAAGLAKRTAWEATFGGFTTADGQYLTALQKSAKRLADRGETVYYDSNAQYKLALERIEAEHGKVAAREVKDLVLGAMGHNNLGVKKWARVSQEWATGITNLMILGFSGVASIPELATAPVRAGFGFQDIVASLKNHKEAKRFAADIGVAMTTGAEQAMREAVGEGYESSMLTKANNLFFSLNGQQFITRLSRTTATAIGMRYVLKAAADSDYRSLEKLGLTPEQVRQWDKAGRPAFTPEMEGAGADLARAVSTGIAQFVNEGTLNPNKFQATGWGNDPYMKVIWHLKQFLWTMGDTVLGGIWRNMKQQVKDGQAAGYSTTLSSAMALATPMMAMGLLMPLAVLSLGLRGLLAGQDRFDEEWDDLAVELVRKSGAFAQWDLLHGLWSAYQWDQGPVGYAGALVPTVGLADQILIIRGGAIDASASAVNLTKSAPLVGQWKGAWHWMVQ